MMKANTTSKARALALAALLGLLGGSMSAATTSAATPASPSSKTYRLDGAGGTYTDANGVDHAPFLGKHVTIPPNLSVQPPNAWTLVTPSHKPF